LVGPENSPRQLPPGARDLDTKLAAALERVGQALRTELRQRARRHGLTPTQAQVLLRLAHDPARRRRVGALAAEFDLTQPTLSDSVAVLLRKELVERVPDPADARAHTLHLTRRGAAAARDLESWDECVRGTLADVPRAEKEDALVVLLNLIADLHEIGVVSVARTCVTCRHLREDVAGGRARHHCALLDMPLARADLRVDCPEHDPAAAA
jgi:DNA-binding MarR family transcriptional regulator